MAVEMQAMTIVVMCLQLHVAMTMDQYLISQQHAHSPPTSIQLSATSLMFITLQSITILASAKK